MKKVLRSDGSTRNLPRSSHVGFQDVEEIEPEWMLSARKLDPQYDEMVKRGVWNKDGSSVDKTK